MGDQESEDDPPILLNPYHVNPVDAITLMDKEYLTYDKIANLGYDFVNALCITNGVAASDQTIDPMGKHKALYSAILDRGITFSVRADIRTEALMVAKLFKKIKESAPEKHRTGIEQQHSPEIEKPVQMSPTSSSVPEERGTGAEQHSPKIEKRPVPMSPSSLFGLGNNVILGCDPKRPFVTFRAAEEVADQKVKEGELQSYLHFDKDQLKLFIHLRGDKYKQYFEGNQNRKVIGWLNVLNDMGIEAIKENITKCRKKWISLRNSYTNCLADKNHQSQSVHFDELDKVFQNDKDSIPLYTTTLKKKLLSESPDFSPVKKMKL